MTQIYVLIGNTGCWSDRTEWLVCAYKDKDLATAACNQANQEASDYFTKHENYYAETGSIREQDRITMLTIDPTAMFDYTGTSYDIKECKLI
jgi:hypothetical protein